MTINKKVLVYTMLVLFAIAVFTSHPKVAKAQLEITAYVDPQIIIYAPENATLGQRFNVTIWINATETFQLMMWQVFLSYDDSIINITRGWPNMNEPNWDPEYVFYNKGGQAVNPIYYRETNSPIGKPGVMLGHTLLTEIDVTSPKKVCVVEFEITKVENGLPFTCELGINNAQTFFYRGGAQQLDVTLIGGEYNFVSEFTLFSLLMLMLAATAGIAIVKIKTRRKLGN